MDQRATYRPEGQINSTSHRQLPSRIRPRLHPPVMFIGRNNSPWPRPARVQTENAMLWFYEVIIAGDLISHPMEWTWLGDSRPRSSIIPRYYGAWATVSVLCIMGIMTRGRMSWPLVTSHVEIEITLYQKPFNMQRLTIEKDSIVYTLQCHKFNGVQVV